ncbi:aminopeptidase [Lentzea sp. NBRC 105346]|nr:aminopeptidase [Lentzea sp. NBRC 105346]
MTAAALSPAVAAIPVTSATAAERDWPTGPGLPNRPQQPDRELRRVLAEIDQRRLEATVRKLASFGTRHTLSSQTDPARGIGAARDWIFNELKSYGGRLTVELQSYLQQPTPRVPVPTTITNVLATLPGTTDRVYVVSGHYDSRAGDVMDFTSDAPGADDDASGVAAVMELARVLATRTFEATIIFAAVAGEEQGLLGAAHLAEQLKGRNLQAMFTNDIVGASRTNVLRLFAEGVPTAETPEQAAIRRSVGGENDSPSRQLARFVTDVASNSATDMTVEVIHRRDRYLRGGDHIPFLERGFPAARFTEPHEDYAHQHQNVRVENGVQYGDLVQFCDFPYLLRVTKVNAAVMWSLASGPGTPRNVRIRTNRLTNETDLVWDGEPGREYEVVWRPTDTSDWTHRIPVGATTAHTVNLSKDNAFFGVRAIGKDGKRSPAAFPVPAP